MERPNPITQEEMSAADIKEAQTIARHLGYEQFAYTSSSDMWGLFCLAENPKHWEAGALHRVATLPPFRPGVIIKTKEFGLLFVQDKDDLGV